MIVFPTVKADFGHDLLIRLQRFFTDSATGARSISGASMVNPRSPTQQLMEKYTHEVFIEIGRKGQRLYKYDKCRQQQDYYGWKPRQRKEWLEVNEFKPVPLDVFEQYDEMRLSLVDEMFVSIDDAMADTNLESLMRKIQPIDIKLLRLIKQHGPIHYHKLKSEFGEKGKRL